MATVPSKRSRITAFSASDEVIGWIESVAGFVAHIRTNYGSVSELIEHPQWDESRSNYAASMLAGLEKEILTLSKQFSDHVKSRTKRR